MVNTVGIFGLGSIGRRHARILNKLDKNIKIFACRTKKGSLQETPDFIINISKDDFSSKSFDIVIISNPTSLHFETIKEVIKIGNAKKIVVEKPFCLPHEVKDCKELLFKNKKCIVLPANCIRFHPAIDIVRNVIASSSLGRPLECLARFGTYMPSWHPYEDYKTSYASRRDLGGGVLLTSIHEIDIVCHLFGKPILIKGYSDNIGLKDIDVEDVAHILLSLERCPIANISLNFIQRDQSRFLEINFENGTVRWNFSDPVVRITKDDILTEKKIDNRIDSMYESMWKSVIEDKYVHFEMNSVYNSLDIIGEILNKKGG